MHFPPDIMFHYYYSRHHIHFGVFAFIYLVAVNKTQRLFIFKSANIILILVDFEWRYTKSESKKSLNTDGFIPFKRGNHFVLCEYNH